MVLVIYVRKYQETDVFIGKSSITGWSNTRIVTAEVYSFPIKAHTLLYNIYIFSLYMFCLCGASTIPVPCVSCFYRNYSNNE